MRVIIAGSRGIDNYDALLKIISQSGFEITTVISGCAKGVDALGERYAEEKGIPIEKFPADWYTHKKAAGVIRNGEMAKRADALIALWDGESPGTKNMIAEAKRRNLKVFVVRFIDGPLDDFFD